MMDIHKKTQKPEKDSKFLTNERCASLRPVDLELEKPWTTAPKKTLAKKSITITDPEQPRS